ncbi:hypothetical protein PQX77_017467 [Marasmius sp. AFHP31]|nr:hypothetical protein PQX77_017467 [Marasmius sp. AFHP31]
MLDQVLAILPGTFTPIRRLSLSANIWLSLSQRSPFLAVYIPQVFLQPTEEAHPNWKSWTTSHLCSTLEHFHCTDGGSPNRQVDFQGLLELVRKSTEESPSTEKFKETPEDAIPVLARLVRALVTYARQTSRRDHPADPDTMFLLQTVVTLTLQVLIKVLRGPRSITLALNVGIAKAIFEIPHYSSCAKP